MIYIDPPYNTGNDSFIYPDKFSESKEEYLKRIGDKDEAGYLTKEGFFRKNSKENGQFHSNWLSMMYPRLFLARNLLCDDGVIFVSIDGHESHNLRLVMDEVFGEENFVGIVAWKKTSGSSDTDFSYVHEDLIVFMKDRRKGFGTIQMDEKTKRLYGNPDGDPRGPWASADYTAKWTPQERPTLYYPIENPFTKKKVYPHRNRVWNCSPEVHQMNAAENRVWWGINGELKVPRYKRFLSDSRGGVVPRSIWDDVGGNQDGLYDFLGLNFKKEFFSNPKPVKYMKRMIQIATKNSSNDIVMDFFAGSGTTAQAVLELNKEDGGNRRFVLVQLPENTAENSEANKAGYKTIADICKERIQRVCKNIKEEAEKNASLFAEKKLDIGFKAFTLEPSNFKIWRTDTIESEEDLKHQMEAFVDPVRGRSEAEDMAWEILLKSGYELTTPMERIEVAGVPTYSIADGELILFLEAVSQEAIDAIIARKPKRVICLDRLFSGNDQLKTNTALQMKDAGVEFRTI